MVGKCVKKWGKMFFCYIFVNSFVFTAIMISFIGDYTAKIDSKGRLSFPSGFLKQMPESSYDRFVIKTDIYEKCLILYSSDEWERQMNLISAKTNAFNPKHAMFIREFYKGTAELRLDSSYRLLIPSRLLEYAEIEKDVYLLGQNKKIEIWSKLHYETKHLSPQELAKLAEEIMGGELPEL
jgi:MraZ protein